MVSPGRLFGTVLRNACFIALYIPASKNFTCPGWLTFSTLTFSVLLCLLPEPAPDTDLRLRFLEALGCCIIILLSCVLPLPHKCLSSPNSKDERYEHCLQQPVTRMDGCNLPGCLLPHNRSDPH